MATSDRRRNPATPKNAVAAPRGRGRPRTGHKMKLQMVFYVSHPIIQNVVDLIAKSEGMSRGEWMREQIRLATLAACEKNALAKAAAKLLPEDWLTSDTIYKTINSKSKENQ